MSLLCFKVACPPIISWMWRWSFFRLLAISFFCLSALYTDTQSKFSDSFAFSHFVLLKFCKKKKIVFRLCYNIWTSAFWASPFLLTFEMFLHLKWSPPVVYSTGWTQIGKMHTQGWQLSPWGLDSRQVFVLLGRNCFHKGKWNPRWKCWLPAGLKTWLSSSPWKLEDWKNQQSGEKGPVKRCDQEPNDYRVQVAEDSGRSTTSVGNFSSFKDTQDPTLKP